MAAAAVSGFFAYAGHAADLGLGHHEEIGLPMPDDRFAAHGIKWEWNDYVYDVNEEISFTVSRYAKACGDVFDARIVAADRSETFWQESATGKCSADPGEPAGNGHYSVLVVADFPSQDSPIRLEKEGRYVLRIESRDSHVGVLEGQIVVKNKTGLDAGGSNPDAIEWEDANRTCGGQTIDTLPSGTERHENAFSGVSGEFIGTGTDGTNLTMALLVAMVVVPALVGIPSYVVYKRKVKRE